MSTKKCECSIMLSLCGKPISSQGDFIMGVNKNSEGNLRFILSNGIYIGVESLKKIVKNTPYQID